VVLLLTHEIIDILSRNARKVYFLAFGLNSYISTIRRQEMTQSRHPCWAGRCAIVVGMFLTLIGTESDAQTYPIKPITLVSPFAAGGTSDVVARAAARVLEQDLGQPVIVVNRAGAGGTLGIGSVATAPADGYTLVMGGLGSIVFPSVVYKGRIKFDASTDLVPVGAAASAPTVIAVRSSLPATSLAELVTAAKAQPNGLSFGSAGIGGSLHVAGVLLEREAGISLNHIPYKGGAPAMSDLAGGVVDIALADLTLVKPLLSSGRIRVLAIASGERSPMLPDVPTTSEVGLPGVRLDTWYALFAPAGTATAVLGRLRASMEKLQSNASFVNTLFSQGLVPLKGSATDFAAQVKKDFDYWPPILTRICAQSGCN
jgi:tripartite-type tricarboxylate transporter receptor subunit TctC